MTTPAIIMLIVAVCTVWGGFIAAVLHLRRTPEVDENDQGFIAALLHVVLRRGAPAGRAPRPARAAAPRATRSRS